MYQATRVARAFGSQKLAKYNYLDPLNLRSCLSEDEIMIQDMSREFAKTYCAPGLLNFFRNETFDKSLFLEMGKAGLIGCTQSDYGCSGVSYVSYGLVNHELERVDSAFRTALSVQSCLVIYPISTFASKAIKDKYLPKLVSGEWVGSYGLTEPDHGSDASGMETKAVRKGDKFILNGTKTWITHAPIADVFVIWGKDEAGEIRGFVLDRGMKGISTPAIHNKWSLRASPTGQVVMEDVEVPVENMLEVKGMKGPFACLNNARYGIAWGVLAAAEDCFHRTLEYTLNR